MVSAREALDRAAARSCGMLDVRSEGEFAAASIPGFRNAPILRDAERHAVGLCYRLRGQDAAIALGYELVGPVRQERVEHWLTPLAAQTDILLCCWRGGLRSKIAAEWIEAAGRTVLRVEGGYKAMRRELLESLNQPRPMQVLSGLTGAGKTDLLHALPLRNQVNIEECAAHRGSSFGRFTERPQPTQTDFENQLAWALRGFAGTVLVEDESKVIGQRHIPEPFFGRLMRSPLIVIEASLAERCQRIYREYVQAVLASGVNPEHLRTALEASTLKLQRRLGGLLTSQVLQGIRSAFAAQDPDAHARWIAHLLRDYYDLRYRHAQARLSRPVIFQGSYEECYQWIMEQYA